MWSTILSLIGVQTPSPLDQQLTAQLRSLRSSNASFYSSVSKHPEDPAYVRCATLVAMIDMATWINRNHDRVIEEGLTPVNYKLMLQQERAKLARLNRPSESDHSSLGSTPSWSSSSWSIASTEEGEPMEVDEVGCTVPHDKCMWVVDRRFSTEDDWADHDTQNCPLTASSCWICSEVFEVRHHPNTRNVDWSRPTGHARYRAIRDVPPADDTDILIHDQILEGLGERCPIQVPAKCWVCCHRTLVARHESLSVD